MHYSQPGRSKQAIWIRIFSDKDNTTQNTQQQDDDDLLLFSNRYFDERNKESNLNNDNYHKLFSFLKKKQPPRNSVATVHPFVHLQRKNIKMTSTDSFFQGPNLIPTQTSINAPKHQPIPRSFFSRSL